PLPPLCAALPLPKIPRPVVVLVGCPESPLLPENNPRPPPLLLPPLPPLLLPGRRHVSPAGPDGQSACCANGALAGDGGVTWSHPARAAAKPLPRSAMGIRADRFTPVSLLRHAGSDDNSRRYVDAAQECSRGNVTFVHHVFEPAENQGDGEVGRELCDESNQTPLNHDVDPLRVDDD